MVPQGRMKDVFWHEAFNSRNPAWSDRFTTKHLLYVSICHNNHKQCWKDTFLIKLLLYKLYKAAPIYRWINECPTQVHFLMEDSLQMFFDVKAFITVNNS